MTIIVTFVGCKESNVALQNDADHIINRLEKENIVPKNLHKIDTMISSKSYSTKDIPKEIYYIYEDDDNNMYAISCIINREHGSNFRKFRANVYTDVSINNKDNANFIDDYYQYEIEDEKKKEFNHTPYYKLNKSEKYDLEKKTFLIFTKFDIV